MIFGKRQRHIRLEGRMTPDQSVAADFLGPIYLKRLVISQS